MRIKATGCWLEQECETYPEVEVLIGLGRQQRRDHRRQASSRGPPHPSDGSSPHARHGSNSKPIAGELWMSRFPGTPVLGTDKIMIVSNASSSFASERQDWFHDILADFSKKRIFTT
jgi:hypothetical protein